MKVLKQGIPAVGLDSKTYDALAMGVCRPGTFIRNVREASVDGYRGAVFLFEGSADGKTWFLHASDEKPETEDYAPPPGSLLA